MSEKDLLKIKPRIRLIRTNGRSIYECKSREAAPRSSRARYGYGDSLRNAYLSWLGVSEFNGGIL